MREAEKVEGFRAAAPETGAALDSVTRRIFRRQQSQTAGYTWRYSFTLVVTAPLSVAFWNREHIIQLLLKGSYFKVYSQYQTNYYKRLFTFNAAHRSRKEYLKALIDAACSPLAPRYKAGLRSATSAIYSR